LNDIISRVPPHSLEAERSVLGSMLRDSRKIPEIQVILRPEQSEQLFYQHSHQRIYSKINSIYNRNSQVDLVLLSNEFRDEIEDVGGYGYLADIFDGCPTSANAEYYATIVAEKAQQRAVLRLCDKWTAEAYNPAEPGKLDEFGEQLLLDLVQQKSGSKTAGIQKECFEIMDDFDKPIENTAGYNTGLPAIDMHFQFEPGTLTTIGARPSVGKSLGLLQFCHHLADYHRLPTLIISLEMRRKENVQRLLSLRSQTRFSAVRRKTQATNEEWQAITKTLGELSNLPIQLNAEEHTIHSIKAETIRAKLRHKIKVLAVDYLQLVDGVRSKGESRAEEVGRISKGLKRLAIDHDLIVIAACQLNRETEKSARPKLSDLRESGSIEQDSDNVMLLWRDDTYLETNGRTRVLGSIAKQRNGPLADFEVYRNAQYMRLEGVI